jgi:8-oxo-dGTP diphosphatase
VVHVAAAAVFNSQGQVLITRRAEHQHQGGLWEFPGGKVETNESVRDALSRELHEEIGIDVQQARPLIRVRHDYPDKSVLLDVWRVDAFSGEAHGREGQPLAWVQPADLANYDFPAANDPIARAVQLPEFFLITPNPDNDIAAFLTQLEKRLRDGIRLVQLRAKSMPEVDYIALAKKSLALCEKHNALLMLNADPTVAVTVGAHGVHLDSGRLQSLSARPNVKWVSASCHSLEQLQQAEKLGADFMLLSPVAATASHPDTVPLGWQRFAELTEQVSCPVYALGGMTPSDLQLAFEHGGQGVAAIRALWE